MVLQLIRALPGVPGFLAPLPFRSSLKACSQRRKIRTTAFRRPHRPRSSRAPLYVHRIPPPTFVTIGRSAPPEGAGCEELSILFGKTEEKFSGERGRLAGLD